MTAPAAATWRTPASRVRTAAASAREAYPDVVMFALATVLLTAVWRLQDLFAPLALLRPTYTTFGLVLGLYLVDRSPQRRVRLLRSTALGFAVSLLVVLVIGAPVSVWPAGTADFLLTDFIPTILLAVLVAATVRGVRDVEFVVLVLVAGAAIFSVYILATVDVGATGRLGRLRYYDVNDLALLVVSSMPLAVLLLRPGSSVPRRLFALVALAIFVVTLVYSGSRGGFLSFVVVGAYLLFRYHALPVRVRVGSVVAGVLLLLAAGSDRYWSLIQTLLRPQQDYNWSGNAYDGRIEVWKRGLGYVVEHPALGLGAAAFPVAEGELSAMARRRHELHKDVKWSVAHNSYLQVAAEGGLPGFALFMAMGVAALRALRRVSRAVRHGLAAPRHATVAQALHGALIGFAVGAFFISAQYFAYLYVLVGLVAGLEKLVRASARETRHVAG